MHKKIGVLRRKLMNSMPDLSRISQNVFLEYQYFHQFFFSLQDWHNFDTHFNTVGFHSVGI